MPGFLLLVLEDEAAHAALDALDARALLDARAAFVAELRGEGVLLDEGQLHPSGEGVRLRRVEERVQVERGPFAEEGRALGAYLWVEAPNVEAAAALAQRCPALPGDLVDVRPLRRGRVDEDKEGKPGKLVACAVLGSAPTEEGWTQVMDRIEAETRGRLVGDSILGGMRLEAPTTGRRVAQRGEKRAAVDGPFLESKEVLGGVFFLRVRSLEEAVRWASETRFLAHGALELRELWRG